MGRGFRNQGRLISRMDSSPRQIWNRAARLRWPWMVALLIIAAAYYGSYVRHSIGFRDEGQTVALCAQRLLQGEIPFKDVVLNYNVLWFYPVVALFKAFGTSYVLLRGYCFALSTLAAVLGFFLVEKTTRRPPVAFAVALLLILIPGSTFKNYMPLLAVANTLCLLQVALVPPGQRGSLWRAAVGGLVLGLTLLIRIDVGMLFGVLWLGLLLLRVTFGTAALGVRARNSLFALFLLIATTLLVHWPIANDANRRGFGPEFREQYEEKARMFANPVLRSLGKNPLFSRLPKPAAEAPPAALPELTPPVPPGTATADKKILQRATVKEAGDEGQNRGADFLFLMYAPVAVMLVLVAWGATGLIQGWRRGDPELAQTASVVLVLIGGALTAFPQFFFFRPDIPHLSEFMPGFLTAAVASMGLLWRGFSGWRNWRGAFTIFLLIHAAIYFALVFPDRWAGTSAVRKKRTKFFQAENGVNVYVSSRELTGLTEIQRLLRQHAPEPDDFVVCYPYSPGINLLANRRTYEPNVYVDNATRTSRWDEEAVARIQKFRPAAIVLSDWDINGSEASRFSVWAIKAKTWIQTHYIHQGTYIAGSDAFEIYTRP
jgi:hypothetical protein